MLLRPEFSSLRDKAIAKKNTSSVNNIISMGSNDINNITQSILENIPNNYSVTVLLGKYLPHNKMVKLYQG